MIKRTVNGVTVEVIKIDSRNILKNPFSEWFYIKAKPSNKKDTTLGTEINKEIAKDIKQFLEGIPDETITSKQPVCPHCGHTDNESVIYNKVYLIKSSGKKECVMECVKCGKSFRIDYELTFKTEAI